MLKVARRYTRADYDAEDIANDSLVALYGKTEVLRRLQPAQLRAYIIVTVRNYGLMAIRNSQRIPPMVEITSELCKDNDFQNPEKSLIQLCTMEELRKTIRSMEPGEREILILKYYSHMSNAQIAKKLNIKEGTVRVKLMRARQRLYKLILKSDSGSE